MHLSAHSSLEVVTCVILSVLTLNVARTEVPRPRGVSLAHAALYDPSKEFACFDGTRTIPFAQVNDDYCDCPDGSDEPGTAACANGMFHCTNVGHQALNIFSSRVNDGVCDCCDGTDEYASGRCRNNCKQLGQHAREAAQRHAELVKAGRTLRTQMSADGIKLKQAKRDKLVELQKQHDEAELVLKEKEAIKKQIEDLEQAALEEYRKLEEEMKQKKAADAAEADRKEALNTFVLFDSDADGFLSVHELQTRQPFDTDRNGEVSEEEAKSYLDNRDSINADDFVTFAWPHIKTIMLREAGIFKPPGIGQVEEVPLSSDTKEVHEDIDEGQLPETMDDEEEEDEDDDATDASEIDHPAEDGDDVDVKIEYDEETQNLVNQATHARGEFTDAEAAVRSIKSEMTDIEDYLRKDFGADEAFAALEGECFEYSDHEYIYRLCPFDKAVQQAKASAADTRLGTWGKWTGTPENVYESMLYDHGQSCWNGPQRSTKVLISCSSENKLISVAEPNRCEYVFEFSTPAACYEVEHREDVHDEL